MLWLVHSAISSRIVALMSALRGYLCLRAVSFVVDIKPPGVVACLTAANRSRDCRKVRLENMPFEQTRQLALPLAIAAEPQIAKL